METAGSTKTVDSLSGAASYKVHREVEGQNDFKMRYILIAALSFVSTGLAHSQMILPDFAEWIFTKRIDPMTDEVSDLELTIRGDKHLYPCRPLPTSLVNTCDSIDLTLACTRPGSGEYTIRLAVHHNPRRRIGRIRPYNLRNDGRRDAFYRFGDAKAVSVAFSEYISETGQYYSYKLSAREAPSFFYQLATTDETVDLLIDVGSVYKFELNGVSRTSAPQFYELCGGVLNLAAQLGASEID